MGAGWRLAQSLMTISDDLAPGDVHVWRIGLRQPDGVLRSCWRLLASDERLRARRYRFEGGCRSFVVGRGAMRDILSRYVGTAPARLRFAYTSAGKPHFPLETGSAVTFNLTHSSELAVLAVAKSIRVGVDVERRGSHLGVMVYADRFLAPGEAAVLRAVGPADKADAFLDCWTRKEAYLKAGGEGLSMPLDAFDVAFGPGVRPALLRVDGDPHEPSRWSLYALEIDPEYRGALFLEGHAHAVRHCTWTWGRPPAE